jgi:copper homeostasis protein
MALVEVCVTSVASARAAQCGGAARIELVSDLLEGGVTPSAGLIAGVRAAVTIGLQVIIRPRGGDFCYDADEYSIMEADVRQAHALGADGVVLGLLDLDGQIDRERTRRLVELARPMNVTFHRAFDLTRDPRRALEDVIATGADRLLTSGAARTAEAGADLLSDLVRTAGARIVVMAGGGVRPHNAAALLARTAAPELHAGLEEPQPSPMRFRNQQLTMGAATDREYLRFVAREETVRALVEASI